MKIFTVSNNYIGCEGDPQVNLLADSSLHKPGEPLFIPDFDSDFRLFPSLAIRIDRLGKTIDTKFGSRYYDFVAPGANLVACGDLERLRETGAPYAMATAFDSAAITAPFARMNKAAGCPSFRLKAGSDVILWQGCELRFGIDEVISLISSRFILRTGDIIFVGLAPAGIPVRENEVAEFDWDYDVPYCVKIK